MLKRLLYRYLVHRHPWRHVGFDELSELYVSMMLRSLGISLIGIFVPIYLYKLGYSVATIILFFVFFSAVRVVGNIISGYIVARVGPKHAMLISNLLQISNLLLLLTLPQFQWPLWTIAATWALASSLFFVAYHVDFSKIMHSDHGGKELGYMTILERLGAALGPVAGGVVATVFGAGYTLSAAIVLLLCAVVPLFLTKEPTKTNQQINFRFLNYQELWRDFASWGGMAVDTTFSIFMWPLFIAITIFTVNTYASIGLVTSLGVVTSIVVAHGIGQLIDHKRGNKLLNWSVNGNALLHLIRPFIASFGGVVLTNIAHEFVSTGYRLPYLKGVYDRADNLPGYRIVYIVVIETIGDIARTFAWLSAFALVITLGPVIGMQLSFIVAAMATLFIRLQRFPALRVRY